MKIIVGDTMPIRERKQSPDDARHQASMGIRKDRRKNKKDRRREERDGVFVSLSYKKDRRSGVDRRKRNREYQ